MSLFLRLVLATGSVVFWQLLLLPDRLNQILWLYLFIICLLPLFSRPAAKPGQAGSALAPAMPVKVFTPWFFPALLAAGGVAVLLGMLVVPYSAYLIWFDLLLKGAARGTVSWTVAGLACYLSVLALAALVRGRIIRQFLLWLLVNLLLLYILLRDSRLLLAAATAGLLFMLLPLAGRNRPLHSRRGLATVGILAAAAFLLPQLSAGGKSAGGDWLIDRHLSRGVRTVLTKLAPRFPLLYGVGGFWHGNSFSTDQPGGEIFLSSRMVLLLEGEPGRAYYLRTGAQDYYQDGGWRRSGEAESSDRISIKTGADTEQEAAADPASGFTLTILDDFFPYLPHTLHTTAITLPRPLEGIEQYEDSIALDPVIPLLYGDILQVVETPAGGTIDSGDTKTDATSLSESDRERYTALPELDRRLTDLAETLRGLPPHRFQTTLAALFSKDYSYTLNPENDRSGKEFVTNFLFETREGYCVHYATAALILARLNGIPARYVSGYLAIPPLPDQEDQEDRRGPIPATARIAISGLNSHAWVELWFAETGWITFEATPPLRLLVAGSEAARNAEIDQYSRRQLSAISGRQIQTISNADTQDGKPSRWWLLPAALSVLLAVSALLYRLLHNKLKKLIKNRPGRDRLGKLLRRILKASDSLSIPDPRLHGWLLWEKTLAARIAAAAAVPAEAQGGSTVSTENQNNKGSAPVLPDLCDLSITRDCLFGRHQPAEQDYRRLEGLLHWLKQEYLAETYEEEDD